MALSDLYQEQRQSLTEIKDEANLVENLTRSILQSGILTDRSSIINVYVSLKSRPLIILSGPDKGQKDILIRHLARFLIGEDSFQFQPMIGHPWWADRGYSQSFLTQLHTRYNSEKILDTLEEAAQPGNRQHVFLASMNQISKAELLSFFADMAFQIQHKELIRFGDIHLPAPVPFPPNMFLIGTIDDTHFDGWSQDILSGVTVIHCAGKSPTMSISPDLNESQEAGESIFLKSCFRDLSSAYSHLLNVLGNLYHTPLAPLFEIKAITERHDVVLPPHITNDVILYLANAWSIEGDGLFNPATSRNLEIALDYAIAQLLLPWIVLDHQESIALFEALKEYFLPRFPISYEQILCLE